jgi:FkbM family methyltransferase
LGETASRIDVRRVRSAALWRLLYGLLPLGQRLNALISWFVAPRGLIAVPWGRHWLTIDAAWLGVLSTASAPIYQAPRRQSPEFFALVVPLLAGCGEGIIADIGANIGVYTINFRAADTRPIVAFEPEPSIFALLARNVSDNALASVTVRNVACGDQPGMSGFRGGINGEIVGDDADGTMSVPVVRLDDELRGTRVAFIKIDCEGYEWHVLNGSRDLMATWRPALFVELHPKLISRYGHSLYDVCDLLRSRYELEFWQFNPHLRARFGALRFLARYRQSLRRFPGEAAMLAQAAQQPVPDQIFLCAPPRGERH